MSSDSSERSEWSLDYFKIIYLWIFIMPLIWRRFFGRAFNCIVPEFKERIYWEIFEGLRNERNLVIIEGI
jgi:hypothetical protein